MHRYRFRKRSYYDFIVPKPKHISPLQQYRDELSKLLEKSQDSFEKQLSYISAGTIGVTVAFIEKVIPASEAVAKGFLYTGWFLLAATLFTNLYSHVVAFRNHSETITDIDTDSYNKDKAVARNRQINWYNRWSVWFMVSGIATILLFITINMLLMAKEIKPQPNRGLEKKGRESSPPPDTTHKSVPLKHGRESPPPPPTQSPKKTS